MRMMRSGKDPVFQIVKIVGKLVAGVFQRGAIGVVHLRPARDPGFTAWRSW
jgi:hypothetical protein